MIQLPEDSRGWDVLRFIHGYVDDHGWPPSVREIAEGVGLSSPSTAHRWLRRLTALGLIRLGPGARQVVVVDPDAHVGKRASSAGEGG